MKTRAVVCFLSLLAVLFAAGTASAAAVSCTGVAAWSDCCGCTFTAGQQVTFGSPSSRYHAAQTFTNTCGAGWTPAAVASLWTLDGSCSTTATATATATTVRPTVTATFTRTSTATATATGVGPTATSTSTRTATATATRTPTATATATVTSGGAGCAPAWVSTTQYCVGNVASVGSNNYTAAFCSQGANPTTNNGPAGSGQPWKPPVACGGGPSPTATMVGPTPTNVPPGTVNLHRALYVMPYNNPIDIATYMNETGLKSFMISFVLAGGGCNALWDGTHPIGDAVASTMISTIRSKGGDVAISQGGFNGTKLGQACSGGTGAGSAYAAMKAVVNAYGVKAVDFDVEEPEIESINISGTSCTGAVCNELDAIHQFAADGLTVSITMPTTTAGINFFGGQTADAMKLKGICAQPNVHVRIMPFDGGFTQPSGTQQAGQALHDQMMTHCGWDSATSWSRIGVSGMIGRSDTGEFTQLSDWQTIINWASSNGMPDLTTWAEQRDRPCTPIYGQVDPGTKGDCSSVTAAEGAFGAAMK